MQHDNYTTVLMPTPPKTKGFDSILVGGYTFKYFNGQLHCNNGPAIESPSGIHQWFVYGNNVSEVEFKSFLLAEKLNNELFEKQPSYNIKI